MKTLLTLMLMAATLGATERHIWFYDTTAVPGLPQSTEQHAYGVEVLMDSDSEASGFDISLTVQLSTGEVRTITGHVDREDKADDVMYSTAWASFFADDCNFTVLHLEVTETE